MTCLRRRAVTFLYSVRYSAFVTRMGVGEGRGAPSSFNPSYPLNLRTPSQTPCLCLLTVHLTVDRRTHWLVYFNPCERTPWLAVQNCTSISKGRVSVFSGRSLVDQSQASRASTELVRRQNEFLHPRSILTTRINPQRNVACVHSTQNQQNTIIQKAYLTP